MKNILLFIFNLVAYVGIAQCTDPVITDFECSSPSHPITGALVNIANPFPSGINNSANVGEYTDNGTDGFDALVIDYGTPIDLSTNSVLKLKFYSPSSVQILAKLEGGTPIEIFSNFSAVNTWQEFSFDFSSSLGDGNTRVVLFFNPGVTTSTPTDIYYIDDLLFDAPILPPCTEPVITDFECSAPSQPITGALVTVANPAVGGINFSANVGQYTDDGTQGFDAMIIDYGTAIDLSTESILKLKFYSPSSVQILAKLEGGTPQEIYSDFSLVNTWQEFTFDFSASAGNGNTRVVLFFNPTVTTGTPTDIYYIDDLFFDSTLSLTDIDQRVENLLIYPNPALDTVNIKPGVEIRSFQIMDLSGKVVLKSDRTSNDIESINTESLLKGVYFLILRTPSITHTVKLVKQ
ncbi:T9SS type A sorting domain-containing protein [Sungkyunkwania multivorans]|uniref:T9SS type A sorting domain-containing protein n=1 Tax=Sungkyunkwania multivorans TaxID=1173618 RepID=A0ABW3CTL5_9FLAO